MSPSDTLADLFSKSRLSSLLGKVPFKRKRVDGHGEEKQRSSLGLAIALEDKRTEKQIQRDRKLFVRRPLRSSLVELRA